MTAVVLDASVVAKWLLPEAHTGEALALLASGVALIAPALLRHEIGTSLCRRIASGEITRDQARQVSAALSRMPLTIADSPGLAEAAMDAARASGATYADGVYLALAAAVGCPLVTADPQLRKLGSRGRMAKRIRGIGGRA